MGVRRIPSEHEVAFFGVNQTQDHPQAQSSLRVCCGRTTPSLTVELLPHTFSYGSASAIFLV